MRESAPCDKLKICASGVRAIGPYCMMPRATSCVASDLLNQCGNSSESEFVSMSI